MASFSRSISDFAAHAHSYPATAYHRERKHAVDSDLALLGSWAVLWKVKKWMFELVL